MLHLGKNQYTLEPLQVGAIVVAGTILGRIAAGDPKQASHVLFKIQPAGKNAPQIDPKPILDGWKLLEATAVYRAAGKDPFFGPGAKNADDRTAPADVQGAHNLAPAQVGWGGARTPSRSSTAAGR